MKKFTSLVLCASMAVSGLAASGATVDISYNPATGVVSAKGVATGNTSIITVPHSMSLSDISDSNLYTDFDHILTSGDYAYDFIMPDGAQYGKYKVYVNDGIMSSDTFMYYNPEEADDIIPILNSTSDASSLYSAINENAAKLGIDTEDSFYVENASLASGLLFSYFLPFEDSNVFYNSYFGALAMVAMKDASREEIENLLSFYQSNLGISYSDYEDLSDAQKTDVCSLLSAMDFESEFKTLSDEETTVSFSNLLGRTIALSAVRLSKNRIDLKNIFMSSYKSVFEPVVSSNKDYKSSMETAVFTRLMNVGVFDSFTSLTKSFNDAVAYAKKQEGSGGGSGGSGGGSGGSGGSSSVSVSPDSINPTDEYDNSEDDGDFAVQTSFTVPELTGSKNQYYDVSESDWEYEAVSKLGGNSIISGYSDGSFKPDNMITRAEFSKLITAAFSVKANPQEFSDVWATDWYYPYVSTLAGAGIITGYDGIFNPGANITREDAAVIIYRLSQAIGQNYYGSANFGDLSDVSIYALSAVRSLGNAGIINGDANLNFNPKQTLSRAEAAQILYNFIKAQDKQ